MTLVELKSIGSYSFSGLEAWRPESLEAKNSVTFWPSSIPASQPLTEFVMENEIDHLFVGIEKKSKTQKIFLGSTAQYVILNAPCPVITVK